MTSSYQTLEFPAMATQIRLSLIHPQADQVLKESQAFLLDLAQRFTAFGQTSSLQKSIKQQDSIPFRLKQISMN